MPHATAPLSFRGFKISRYVRLMMRHSVVCNWSRLYGTAAVLFEGPLPGARLLRQWQHGCTIVASIYELNTAARPHTNACGLFFVTRGLQRIDVRAVTTMSALVF
jgi:hypothetical protein